MNPASNLEHLFALLRVNLRSAAARPVLTLATAAMMIGNNLILFLIWVIYFARFSNIRGWLLEDMALLLGIVAWAVGLPCLLVGGVRDLAQNIVDGKLDIYLGRPRHPLPGLLMSRCIPAGIGDTSSAIIFWLWFADRSVTELPLLILVSTCAGIVFTATVVVIQCLVFWFPRAISLCEDLFNMVLMVAFYPQHPYGFFVRMVLFTVFPTAFMSLLPALAVRNQSGLQALAMLGGAVAYSAIAVAVFNRGLRHYASGNRIVELR
jgi:ABC-2 type transport system permease protein